MSHLSNLLAPLHSFAQVPKGHGGILEVLHRKRIADCRTMADHMKEDHREFQSQFAVRDCRSLRAVVVEVGGEGLGGDCGTQTFFIFI